MAADQKLFGGPPLQLDLLQTGRVRRGVEVHVGGVGRASGVGQGFRERDLPPGAIRIRRCQFQRAAVERCRSIERQCGVRLAAGEDRLRRRMLRVSSFAIVPVERLRIVGSERGEDSRDVRMDGARVVRIQSAGERFPYPIVIHLDACRRSAVAHEMVRPQHREQRALVAGQARCPMDDPGIHWTDTEREYIEEAACARRQAADTSLEHTLQR